MSHTDAGTSHAQGCHVPTKQKSTQSSSSEWQLGLEVLLFVERGEKDHFGILGEGLGKATGSHCVLQGEGN